MRGRGILKIVVCEEALRTKIDVFRFRRTRLFGLVADLGDCSSLETVMNSVTWGNNVTRAEKRRGDR